MFMESPTILSTYDLPRIKLPETVKGSAQYSPADRQFTFSFNHPTSSGAEPSASASLNDSIPLPFRHYHSVRALDVKVILQSEADTALKMISTPNGPVIRLRIQTNGEYQDYDYEKEGLRSYRRINRMVEQRLQDLTNRPFSGVFYYKDSAPFDSKALSLVTTTDKEDFYPTPFTQWSVKVLNPSNEVELDTVKRIHIEWTLSWRDRLVDYGATKFELTLPVDQGASSETSANTKPATSDHTK
jgi:hypothetical protein